jgi:hypothetical protein
MSQKNRDKTRIKRREIKNQTEKMRKDNKILRKKIKGRIKRKK